MKFGFYPRLAWTGIKKNKRLYVPYILTCIGVIAMHYIVTFLSKTEILEYMVGGDTMRSILGLGSNVIAIFSVIFLFYTNSFLIRRRKREFGLYNILGMGKGNIGRILLWENVMTALIAITLGLIAGIGLSKFGELGMVNIVRGDVSSDFMISWDAAARTTVIFCGIFLLLFINALRQIHLSNPVMLLRSESAGEKPPKANWLLGIVGVVLLIGAYYLAVSIQDPLSALLWFFVAVIMVVLATYLLFIFGSVVFCRILQKNKGYYYKKNHFVSVSSMAYRMKRNGAGLASICILGTMVLVMLSSTTCLYFGSEDGLHTRYSRDITLNIRSEAPDLMGEENLNELRGEVQQILEEQGELEKAKRLMDYRYGAVTGLLEEGVLETDVDSLSDYNLVSYADVYQLFFIPLSDYNRMMGTSERLEPGQAMIYASEKDYPFDRLEIRGGSTFTITETLDDFFESGFTVMGTLPSFYVVVPDWETSLSPLMELSDYNGDPVIYLRWVYGFDLGVKDQVQIAIKDQIADRIGRLEMEKRQQSGSGFSYSCESLADNRQNFYETYGGIFFLGIMLSIVFLFATVLMIYYKQVSEGYEDQSRFEIMQKVGMTKTDIRKSVNSQMLTVFFLPLAWAVIHLAFAFPMIQKLLMLFNLVNLKLLIFTTGLSVVVFALFYTIVYRITANAYFAIVSGARD